MGEMADDLIDQIIDSEGAWGYPSFSTRRVRPDYMRNVAHDEWKPKDQAPIKIVDMVDSHLENTINFLMNKGMYPHKVSLMQAELDKRMRQEPSDSLFSEDEIPF